MGAGTCKRRFGPAAAVAAALVVPAALLGGCGSSSSASHSATAPTLSAATLTRAADVSAKVAGFKTVMTLNERIPGAGSVSITGSGSFQSSRVGSMALNMSVPVAASAGLSNLQMQLVLAHTAMYMKLPAALASKLPGGKQWIEIELSQVGKAAGASGLSSLMSSDSQLSDPGQYFNYLRAASSGSLQDLGTAQIDGVQTTHYHADIDLSKLPGVVPAAQRAAVEQAVATMHKTMPAGVPLDVWIDSSNLIRQIVLSEALSVSGHAATVNVQEAFPEYGPQPAPAIPPAGEVTNLSSLISSGL
ncbi:MAG: hypothetical protein ACLP8S_25125 [Solirubrobacteraceae bacterium]